MTSYIKIESEARNLPLDRTQYARLSNKYKISQNTPSEAIECKLLVFHILNNKNKEVGSIIENFDDAGENVNIFKSRGSDNYFEVCFETKDIYQDNYEYVEFKTLQEALDFVHKIIKKN